MHNIMNYTQCGDICDTADQVYQTLNENYNEFAATGSIKINTKNMKDFSREHQAKLFAEALVLQL